MSTTSETVRLQRLVCDDVCNRELYGTEIGTQLLLGEGEDTLELYVPDERRGHNEPMIYAPGLDPLPLAAFQRQLPRILRVLADPRLVALLARPSRRPRRRRSVVDELQRQAADHLVRVDRVDYGDDIDGSHCRATRYLVGEIAEVELVDNEGARPTVYLNRRELDTLDEVLQQLPALLAVLADPRVLALRQRQKARAA